MMQRSARLLHTPVRRRSTRARRGFGLIEVMFAVVITSIAIVGMGGMLVQASRIATRVSVRNSRSAVATLTLNRLAAVPYATLESKAGCVTVTAQPFPHTRCVAVVPIAGGSGAKQLQLIIRPQNTAVRPDTLYLTRTSGASINPAAS
ncbi:MAG TPA: prepilin-type N-terminal cleavage/methylation domain-containing protein [Gemmatimonadaceae bacterium]|jgi:prepilin-type N-terminal cleavage/methylation domain-containing protein|nr:prepilin-type N-terminal cleavage/methylation domain-containing protein [Gemmatimonadaceae bacterium]